MQPQRLELVGIAVGLPQHAAARYAAVLAGSFRGSMATAARMTAAETASTRNSASKPQFS
jgi:hypothetical protein